MGLFVGGMNAVQVGQFHWCKPEILMGYSV